MKASDKLRSMAGANIAESMGRGTGATPLPAPFTNPAAAGPDRYAGLNRVKGAFQVPTDRISPDPNQPRKEFDEDALARLSASLKERGQLQPIRVRWDDAASTWVIIAGERRWRAAVRAGLATVAAVEASAPLTEDEVLEEQLVENCVREDLRPVEQAKAFRALMGSRGWSAIRLARALGLDDSSVTRALALLGLPSTVQDRVDAGELAPSVAYEVSKVRDPDEQTRLAGRVVSEGLSRAETVEAVRRATAAKGRGAAKAKKVTSAVFRSSTGARVTVDSKKGLDDALIAAALREALRQAESRLDAGGHAA